MAVAVKVEVLSVMLLRTRFPSVVWKSKVESNIAVPDKGPSDVLRSYDAGNVAGPVKSTSKALAMKPISGLLEMTTGWLEKGKQASAHTPVTVAGGLPATLTVVVPSFKKCPLTVAVSLAMLNTTLALLNTTPSRLPEAVACSV